MRSRVATHPTRASMGASFGYALGLLFPAAVVAHPSPAEPPVFVDEECILVIDKRELPEWHMEYLVPVEDTAFGVDDIRMEDGKSHQFFAVAGRVFLDGDRHVVVPFGDREGERVPMPLWLSQEDIERSAAAVTPEDMTEFTADQVAPEEILGFHPEVPSILRPLLAGTHRVPITMRQASKGVDWDLSDVPPGAYQIVSYIFSPPYNGWEVRRGFIKVKDGDEDPPVVTLDNVGGTVFAGQGRHVSGCVDAPAGTALEISLRETGAMPGEYEPWQEPLDVEGNMFDLCLDNPGLDAVMGVRVEVVSPEGLRMAVHNALDLTFFSREAPCMPGRSVCCPEGAVSGEEGPGEDQQTMTGESMQVGGAGTGAPIAATDPSEMNSMTNGPIAMESGSSDSQVAPEGETPSAPSGSAGGGAADTGGCSVCGVPSGRGWLGAVLAFATCLRLRRRRLPASPDDS